jgi:hypothetical protein
VEDKKTTIKHENPTIGSVLLEDGLKVRTKWGWKAKVTEVVEWQFKFGQGVTVIREDDSKIFSLCPSDLDWACG